MLAGRLVEFETELRKTLPNADKLSDKTYVSFLSLEYNIGVGAFRGSTVARKANAGDLRGACDAILMWDKFKGKTLPGLTKRRIEERQLCREGL